MTSQAATVEGSTGNTIIQIVGDGNRVEAGHPHLTLTRFTALRQIRQDFDRLSPYTRSVPLVGREAQLASLQAFLDQANTVRARVVTGSGGSGKTRLALELCEQCASAGWDTGFATGREMKRFLALQNLGNWGWQRPTLVVIDYAARHAETLGDWIAELAGREALDAPPLRLLLLEREARTDSGWWSEVFDQGGYATAARQALLDPPQPWPVPPLEGFEARLAMLLSLLRSINPEGRLTHLTDDPDLRQRLMAVDWGGDPLTLLMAGLTMVQQGHTQALVARRTDLAEQLARREADRLRELAKAAQLDDTLVLHLAAVATLAQGMTRQAFEAYANTERQALHRAGGGDPANIADLLGSALPRAGGGVAPVLPDLIGEAFTLRCLRGAEPKDAVLRCYAAAGDLVTESLVRTVQDYADANSIPLLWLDAVIDAAFDDPHRLAAIDIRLPMGSTALRHINLRVAQRLVELDASGLSAEPAVRAARLTSLALALSENDHREPALRAAQQAGDLYRALAAARPDVFKSELAMSLNNLANRLSDLGHREPALQAAQQAVDQYRELATARPDVFNPDLAGSLNNLANRLRDIGRRESAMLAAQEAVKLYRELAAARPDVFMPDLAASLNNLAAMLSELGHRESALRAAQGAVNRFRELAAARPHVFKPDLAASLNNLAAMLSKREPAVQAAQEAVNLYRELADARPDVFKSDLAMSLNNLGIMLSELDRREPALQAAQQAVDLYRELAAARPDVFTPSLAKSLFSLALQTEGTSASANSDIVACKWAHESLTTLISAFLLLPDAHADLLEAVLRHYLRLCRATNTLPDFVLINPLLPFLSTTGSNT